MPIMRETRCPVCKDGVRTTRTLKQVVREEHIPCDSDGCVCGYHATRCHLCKGKGCPKCSTVEKHGLVGRALCRNCSKTMPDGRVTSEGCTRCRHKGLILVQCRDCNGRGWVRHITVLTSEQDGPPESSPCPYCGGTANISSAVGNVGMALASALAARADKDKRPQAPVAPAPIIRPAPAPMPQPAPDPAAPVPDAEGSEGPGFAEAK